MKEISLFAISNEQLYLCLRFKNINRDIYNINKIIFQDEMTIIQFKNKYKICSEWFNMFILLKDFTPSTEEEIIIINDDLNICSKQNIEKLKKMCYEYNIKVINNNSISGHRYVHIRNCKKPILIICNNGDINAGRLVLLAYVEQLKKNGVEPYVITETNYFANVWGFNSLENVLDFQNLKFSIIKDANEIIYNISEAKQYSIIVLCIESPLFEYTKKTDYISNNEIIFRAIFSSIKPDYLIACLYGDKYRKNQFQNIDYLLRGLFKTNIDDVFITNKNIDYTNENLQVSLSDQCISLDENVQSQRRDELSKLVKREILLINNTDIDKSFANFCKKLDMEDSPYEFINF